jgi:hypothetical protein
MHKVNYGWLHGNVKPYFDKNGIKLSRDDMFFIEKCLNLIPADRHRTVIKQYYDICNTKITLEDCVEKKGGNARFEANVYLRNAAGLKKGV